MAVATIAAAPADAYADRWRIAVGVLLASLMELIDSSIVNVGLTQMSQTIGASLDAIAWVSTGYILSAVIVLPMTGFLSAWFGRRRYLTGSIIVFTVASVLCGQSRSLGELVAFRLVQGLGGGALIATAQAVLVESFPRRELPVAQGLFGVGMMVGPAVGPTLGGYIVDRLTWPWMFFINLPVGIVAATLCWRYVRDRTGERRPAAIDVPGIALIIVGMGSLQFVLERGQHYGWSQSGLIVALAWVAGLAITGLVWWELRAPNPILNLRVLHDRSLAAGSLVVLALGMALFGSVFALPLYLQQVLGFDALTAGELMFPGAVGSALALGVVSWLGGRVRDLRFMILVGAGVLVTSMLLHARFTTESARHDLFWPIFLRGVGTGSMFVPLSICALGGLRGTAIPQGAAIFNLMRQVGGSTGIALLTTVLARAQDAHVAQLGVHVTAFRETARARLADLAQAMMAHGADSVTAHHRALALLDETVRQQAAMLAYRDVFRTVALIVLLAIPLWFLLRSPAVTEGDRPGPTME